MENAFGGSDIRSTRDSAPIHRNVCRAGYTLCGLERARSQPSSKRSRALHLHTSLTWCVVSLPLHVYTFSWSIVAFEWCMGGWACLLSSLPPSFLFRRRFPIRSSGASSSSCPCQYLCITRRGLLFRYVAMCMLLSRTCTPVCGSCRQPIPQSLSL